MPSLLQMAKGFGFSLDLQRFAKFKFGKIWIGTIKNADLHVKIQNPCGFRSLAFEKSDIKICIIF